MTGISAIIERLIPDTLIKGPMFNEQVIIITVTDLSDPVKGIAWGVDTNTVFSPDVSNKQIQEIEFVKGKEPFSGDAKKFKLAIEAMRIGLAYEHVPNLSLSITRITLPHQLKVVVVSYNPDDLKNDICRFLVLIGKARNLEEQQIESKLFKLKKVITEVEGVEKGDRGYDLKSRRFHAEDPEKSVEGRCIEVKGRAGVGEIGLTSNEYETAKQLKEDYWLYVVYNCASNPEIHIMRDPARLGWKPITQIEHYHGGADAILGAAD